MAFKGGGKEESKRLKSRDLWLPPPKEDNVPPPVIVWDKTVRV